MSHTQKIGQMGEDLACMFLKKRNYQIIDRNYRKPWGEIDIVAQKGNDLRFVEVKTVVRDFITVARETGNDDDYEPEDNIHPWKRKRLRRIIETYLLDKKIDDEIDWQIDALSVYVNREGTLLKIEELEDILL